MNESQNKIIEDILEDMQTLYRLPGRDNSLNHPQICQISALKALLSTEENWAISYDKLQQELSKQTHSAQFKRVEILQQELSAWKETNAESVKEIIKLNLKLDEAKQKSIEQEAFISRLCVERFKLEREVLKADATLARIKALDIESLLKKWGVTDKLGFRYKLAKAITKMIGGKDE